MNHQLTQWNTFRKLEDVHHRLAGLFERTPFRRDREESMAESAWAPLVDIEENEKGYEVRAELPALKRDDIKVSVEGGVLVIAGERKQEEGKKGKRYHRVERSYGSFVRSFSLPDDADAAQISAAYRDGILAVSIPKSEQARPRAIEVNVG
ncbi:MAG TPA: Hsp20/alpha crystallin family protein [Lacunisphaera sp.]|jgi:HSP20 family protein|nr:Hsp20/alpha crystallin family protein [Lacunisphaera sp.]